VAQEVVRVPLLRGLNYNSPRNEVEVVMLALAGAAQGGGPPFNPGLHGCPSRECRTAIYLPVSI
jgi:hypothetical protein